MAREKEKETVDLLCSLDEATLTRWHNIGNEEGLSCDLDICKYLIHLYETANSKVSTHLHCLRCGNPVSMVCDDCRAAPSQPPPVDEGKEPALSPKHQQTSGSTDVTRPSAQMKLIPASLSQDSDSDSVHVELVVMDSQDQSQSQPQQGDHPSESTDQPCPSPTQESDSESMCLECQPATPDSSSGTAELSPGPASPAQTSQTQTTGTTSRLVSLLPGGKPRLHSYPSILPGSSSPAQTSQAKTTGATTRLVSLLPAGKPRLRSQSSVPGPSAAAQTSQTKTTPISIVSLLPAGKLVPRSEPAQSESPLILRSLFQFPSTAPLPGQSPSLPPTPPPLPPQKASRPLSAAQIAQQKPSSPPQTSPLPPHKPVLPGHQAPVHPSLPTQGPYPVSLSSRSPFPTSLPLRIPLKPSHTVSVPVRKPMLTPLTVILPKPKDPPSQSQSSPVSGADGGVSAGPESRKQPAGSGQAQVSGDTKPCVPVDELDPNRDKSLWTELESTSLMEYVKQSGIVSPLTGSFWKNCANFLNAIFKTTRTDTDCSEQYVRLVREDSYLRRVVTVDTKSTDGTAGTSASQPAFTYRLQYMQLLSKDNEQEQEQATNTPEQTEMMSDKSDAEDPPQDDDDDDFPPPPPRSNIRRARHNAWQKVRHREANEKFKRALALELAGETNNMDFIYLGLEELGLPGRSTDKKTSGRQRKRVEEGESQSSEDVKGVGQQWESTEPGGNQSTDRGCAALLEENMEEDLTIPSSDHNYINPSVKLKNTEQGRKEQKQKPSEQGSGRMKAFVCKVCTSYFNQYCKITAHIRHTHSGFRPYKCTNCPASFAIQGQLTKHMRRVHLKLERVLCQLCGSSYCGMHALKQHMAHQHQGVQPKRDFVCELCGKRLASMHSLKCHKERRCGRMRRTFKPRREVCSACGLSFSTMLSLHHHMARKHPEEAASMGPLPPQEEGGGPQIYTCTLCGVPFAFKSSLRHHMGRRHPKGRTSGAGQQQGPEEQGDKSSEPQPMKHLCNVCGAPYAELSSLRRHMNKRHPRSASSEGQPSSAIQQRLEGKVEVVPPSQQQDKRVRSVPQPGSCVCSVCGAPFAEVKLLYHHMAQQHPADTAADGRPRSASRQPAVGLSNQRQREGNVNNVPLQEKESGASVSQLMTHMCSMCGELLAGSKSLHDHMVRLHPAAVASDGRQSASEQCPEGTVETLPHQDSLLAKRCPTGQESSGNTQRKTMAPSLDLMPDDSFHMFLEAELAASYIE